MNLQDIIFENISQIIIVCALLLLMFMLILTLKKTNQKNSSTMNSSISHKSDNHVITSNDIRSIAGGDMVSTQLDLARAYIEIGKKQLARNILNHALKQGSPAQQKEASQLLENLC